MLQRIVNTNLALLSEQMANIPVFMKTNNTYGQTCPIEYCFVIHGTM